MTNDRDLKPPKKEVQEATREFSSFKELFESRAVLIPVPLKTISKEIGISVRRLNALMNGTSAPLNIIEIMALNEYFGTTTEQLNITAGSVKGK
jgi:hypothetical protein